MYEYATYPPALGRGIKITVQYTFREMYHCATLYIVTLGRLDILLNCI